jgi:hypothetical protein
MKYFPERDYEGVFSGWNGSDDDETITDAEKEQSNETKPEPEAPKQEPSNPFNNLGGKADLDSLLSEAQSTPKQDYSVPAGEGEDGGAELPEGGQGPSAAQPPKPLKVSGQSEAAAKMVMKTFDTGWSMGAQLYTGAPERAKYKAEQEDFDDLVEAWALYIESQGMNIPPWLGIALLMVVTYLFKIPSIVKDRKEIQAQKNEAERKAKEKAAREDAIAAAMESEKEPSAGQAVHTDNEGNTSKIDVSEVVTKCLYCQKPLSALQIKRNGKFCEPGHASKYHHQTKNENK